MSEVRALIFDMDGTMVDSMPWHAKAWVEFGRRRGIDIDMADFMRRTTGRTARECAGELLGREATQAESIDITRAFINEFNSKNPATAALTTP